MDRPCPDFEQNKKVLDEKSEEVPNVQNFGHQVVEETAEFNEEEENVFEEAMDFEEEVEEVMDESDKDKENGLEPEEDVTYEPLMCCLLEDGLRCQNPAGDGMIVHRCDRIQQILNIEYFEGSGHNYLCEMHRAAAYAVMIDENDGIPQGPLPQVMSCENFCVQYGILPQKTIRRYLESRCMRVHHGVNKGQTFYSVAHFMKQRMKSKASKKIEQPLNPNLNDINKENELHKNSSITYGPFSWYWENYVPPNEAEFPRADLLVNNCISLSPIRSSSDESTTSEEEESTSTDSTYSDDSIIDLSSTTEEESESTTEESELTREKSAMRCCLEVDGVQCENPVSDTNSTEHEYSGVLQNYLCSQHEQSIQAILNENGEIEAEVDIVTDVDSTEVLSPETFERIFKTTNNTKITADILEIPNQEPPGQNGMPTLESSSKFDTEKSNDNNVLNDIHKNEFVSPLMAEPMEKLISEELTVFEAASALIEMSRSKQSTPSADLVNFHSSDQIQNAEDDECIYMGVDFPQCTDQMENSEADNDCIYLRTNTLTEMPFPKRAKPAEDPDCIYLGSAPTQKSSP